MLNIFEYSLTLVSLTLVGGIVFNNIGDNYCELYLNASKISDKSCHKNDSFIITNEYELRLPKRSLGDLVLKWTEEHFIEWNIVEIAKKKLNLSSLQILGIRSSEDLRLRPASFYLNKLNVEYVDKFEINAEQLVIHEINSHYEAGPTYLSIKFKQSVNSKLINAYVAASTQRIKALRISGLHLPGSDLCNHLKFLSLPELQENLKKLILHVEMTVKMKCFENYRKLTYIIIERPYEPFENLTAFICDTWMNCKFIMGRNGLRCPENCKCSFYHLQFQIICRGDENQKIPPLPIPMDYGIKLAYPGNQLIQLPNNTLPGYIEVVILNVYNNSISSLAIHQLPRKLKKLDISNNPITTIDDGVANYLNGYYSIVYQENIRWIANCDNKSFVLLLQRIAYRQQVLFEQLNGECPIKCKCCFDRSTDNFIIDCSSGDMDFFLELPERGPNKMTLLFGNSSIKKLPINMARLLKFHNITHLDLQNNYLKSLDGETVDFYNNHDNTTIELSGNPWDCICKPRSFLFFLKSRSQEEYTMALARCKIQMCPDSCVCCLENLNISALSVDCRGQQLTRFPVLPNTVTILDLRDNNITEINQQSQEFLKNIILSAELKLFLSGNPWTCTCDENDLIAFAKIISQQIPDFAGMECSNLEKHLIFVEESEICPSFFIYPLLLFVFILIIITALNAFVYFKQPLLMWFYEHEIFMSMAVRLDLERMKKFDAFLSFTHKDEHLIEEYVERLEMGQRKFRLCFYLRDWQVGVSIPECIIQSVKDSRRIIILMTKNFLESTWGKLEFRLALHATTKDRCKRLIVILYPDVENFDDLDSELKAYMVLNTYLRRDSPNFWNKLIYSMPHIT